ncbi:hypothetical protein ITG08_07575 [Vibrio cyclitrophicus]|uniref:hypothetical protein n=1 Tax=Vibrio cyclitrophicus TaxID=47951 RepID=UPI002063C3DF|nr:hypothetical protein [Vibrio cyclitrophicus]UPR26554.1 hypothetical protein ITG08_07575 [Vibrio cyclitrophicus]
MSRREAKKQLFYTALLESLDNLIDEGFTGEITQTKVIANAKFPDGKPVGKTTLYGKNENRKEFIHAEFMKKLDGLIEKANKKTTTTVEKKTASTTQKLKDKRSEYKELEAEYDSVLVQFAELVESKKNVNAASNENRVRTLEADLYVVASLLNSRIDGQIKEIADIVENYKMKHSGQERLAVVNDRVSRLERQIRDSKITSLFGTMNES